MKERLLKIGVIGDLPKSGSYLGGPRKYNHELICCLKGADELEIIELRDQDNIKTSKIRQLFDLFDRLYKNNIDIVHITTHGLHTVIIILLQKIFKFKIVFTAHSILEIEDKISNKTSSLAKILLRHYIIGRVDAVVFTSALLLRDARRFKYKNRNMIAVPPIINSDEIRMSSDNSDLPNRVVIFGQLIEIKGRSNIKSIRESLPSEVIIDWYGYDERNANQKEFAQMLSELDGVNFYPPIDNAQALAEIRSSLCVIIPSLYESFCIVGVESLKSGVPIMLSNNVGLVQHLKWDVPYHPAVLCDFSDTESISSAYRRIVEIHNYAQSDYEYILRDLDPQEIMTSMINLYKAISTHQIEI